MIRTTLTLAAAAALLGGCTTKDDPATTSSTENANEAPAWILTSMPADAQSVVDAKASSAEGDTIAVRGKIGGRLDALGTNVAIFVMMDSSVPSCADKGHDGCPTPWDYCCESPESKMKHAATVQIVDDAGIPRTVSLESLGFELLDEVVVIGDVGERPTEDVLVIRAEKIYRVDG